MKDFRVHLYVGRIGHHETGELAEGENLEFEEVGV